MLNNKLYEVYEAYADTNHSFIKHKLSILERFRTQEDEMKEYKRELMELDKLQIEIGFYKLGSEFRKMKEDLKNFDPNNILKEINKVISYEEMLQVYRGDIESVSNKIIEIERLWSMFINKNKNIQGTYFEEKFALKYRSVIKEINSCSISHISTVLYSLESFKEDTMKIISIIESMNTYMNHNLFIGEKASQLRDKIESHFDKSTLKNEEEAKELMGLLEEIEEIKRNSIYASVGLPVVIAYNKEAPEFKKVSIELNGEMLKYEKFLKSDSLSVEKSGEYMYFENVPYEGIFEIKEVMNSLDYDSNYIHAILELGNKSSDYFYIGLIFTLLLSIFSVFIGSTFLTTIALIISVVLVFGYKYIFRYLKKSVENKYKLKNFFLLKKIGNNIYSFGEEVPASDLIREFFYSITKGKIKHGINDAVVIKKYKLGEKNG